MRTPRASNGAAKGVRPLPALRRWNPCRSPCAAAACMHGTRGIACTEMAPDLTKPLRCTGARGGGHTAEGSGAGRTVEPGLRAPRLPRPSRAHPAHPTPRPLLPPACHRTQIVFVGDSGVGKTSLIEVRGLAALRRRFPAQQWPARWRAPRPARACWAAWTPRDPQGASSSGGSRGSGSGGSSRNSGSCGGPGLHDALRMRAGAIAKCTRRIAVANNRHRPQRMFSDRFDSSMPATIGAHAPPRC